MVWRAESHPVPRQRSPRTDPDLRDGDSGHGNPGEPAGDEWALDSDTDIGDADVPLQEAAEYDIDLEVELADDGAENE